MRAPTAKGVPSARYRRRLAAANARRGWHRSTQVSGFENGTLHSLNLDTGEVTTSAEAD